MTSNLSTYKGWTENAVPLGQGGFSLASSQRRQPTGQPTARLLSTPARVLACCTRYPGLHPGLLSRFAPAGADKRKGGDRPPSAFRLPPSAFVIRHSSFQSPNAPTLATPRPPVYAGGSCAPSLPLSCSFGVLLGGSVLPSRAQDVPKPANLADARAQFDAADQELNRVYRQCVAPDATPCNPSRTSNRPSSSGCNTATRMPPPTRRAKAPAR